MNRYELYLVGHIVGVTLWLGSAVMLQIVGFRAVRVRDEPGMRKVLDDATVLGTRFFVPASLAVLVFGLLMVLDGPWSFGDLWIVLGLIGYAATFVTGFFVVTPVTKRIAEIVERDGGVSAAAVTEIERLFVLTRIDVLVLYLVLADMVLKPTGDDVGTLVAMAAVLLAGTALTVARARKIAPPEPA